MPKKVGIVTIIGYQNVGNRLQNYAVQEVLKDLNMKPVTIRYFNMSFSEKVKDFIKNNFFKRKVSRGRAFSSKWIKFSKYGYNDTISIGGGYDFFVLGSDQVWNPIWYGEKEKEMFLLSFAPPEKRIAFSASFGTDSLPDQWKPWFREHLSKFKRISVREDAGSRIVKELTGKDAKVLIDPTCMFDKDKWDKVAEVPKIDIQSPYIVTYFLGPPSAKASEDIQNYANTYGLAVYPISNLQEKNLVGPGEFLYLISHAKLVLTDSFHGSVFSFLYQKPFLVYTREGFKGEKSMMSRVETFLNKFDLHRKFVDSGLENDVMECDYQTGYAKLKIEREKVKRFLTEALERD